MKVAASVGLAWMLCSACTNVLGLDDMTFDRPEPLAASTASGGNGGGGSVLGPEIEPPPEVYPTVWEPGQTLVTRLVTGDITEFLVYDTEHGTLLAYRAHPYLVEVTRTWEWVAGFSHVVQIPNSEEPPRLLGYETETGLVRHVDQLPGPGPIQGEQLAGTPGWSHLVPFELNDAWYLLSYSIESGHFRVGPADLQSDSSAVTLGTWEQAWTHLVALATPMDAPYAGVFLKYDQSTGDAELARLSEGAGIETLALGNLSAGWSNLASFRRGSETRFVLYATSTGRVTTVKLDLEGESLTWATIEQGLWREGVSDLLAMQIEGSPYAITHSAATGVADVLGLEPLEQAPVVPVR